MSERLPIRLVRSSTRKEHSSTATMPPNRLLTLSMTIKVDPGSAQISFRRARQIPGQGRSISQILEAGLPRASQKETGPCGPVSHYRSGPGQPSIWTYSPFSHWYIT